MYDGEVQFNIYQVGIRMQNPALAADGTEPPPLDENTVTSLVGELYQTLSAHPDITARAAQLQFAETCALVLAGLRPPSTIIAAEAPTGTGKSMAYLLAGAAISSLTGHPVVVSTATLLLEHQLARHDLPLLHSILGDPYLDAEPLVVVGRQRYLCLNRMAGLLGVHPDQGHLFDDADDFEGTARWPRKPRRGETKALRQALEQMIAAPNAGAGCPQTIDDISSHGEVATPEGPPPGGARRGRIGADLMDAIGAKRGTCLGSKCRYRGACPMLSVRKRIRKARIVVANHALVLSSRFHGGILPPPDESYLVFDEGHRVGEIARDAFSGRLDPARAQRALAAMIRALSHLRALYGRVGQVSDLDLAVAALAKAEMDLSRVPAPQLLTGGKPLLRFTLSAGVPDELRQAAATLASAIEDAELAVGEMLATVRDTQQSGRSADGGVEKLQIELGIGHQRLCDLSRVTRLLTAEQPDSPVAVWCTPDEYHASHVDVGAELSARIWKRTRGAVITSATLRTSSGWNYLFSDLGLPPATHRLTIGSPFDYRRSMLVAPRLGNDPNMTDEHSARVARLAVALARRFARNTPARNEPDPHGDHHGHGILLLCTSWRELDLVLDRVRVALPDLPLVCQGQEPLPSLVESLRAHIDAGAVAILAGVASLAEGLDLPGPLCEAVIISKLPFAQPEDPMAEARAEWCVARGGNAFRDLVLPEATRRMAQAVGRLVRNENDRGVVFVCDHRLMSRSYGRLIGGVLPGFRRQTIDDLDAIITWVETLASAPEPARARAEA